MRRTDRQMAADFNKPFYDAAAATAAVAVFLLAVNFYEAPKTRQGRRTVFTIAHAAVNRTRARTIPPGHRRRRGRHRPGRTVLYYGVVRTVYIGITHSQVLHPLGPVHAVVVTRHNNRTGRRPRREYTRFIRRHLACSG